jgi:ABC-type uncharacterized transport system YnjBCD permease subunit
MIELALLVALAALLLVGVAALALCSLVLRRLEAGPQLERLSAIESGE